MADESLRGVQSPDRPDITDHGSPEGHRAVAVGDEAPDFQVPALVSGVKQTFHLRDYRGQKHLVLAFYPFNWQELSARQIAGYQSQRDRVQAAHAEIVGITVDSIMNITAWEREIGPIDFPLCSDFWPHGDVSARYGVLQPSGAAQRALFVVNRDGSIVFQKIYREDGVPPVEDFLGVLQSI